MLNIICPECDATTQDVNEMEQHIIETHPNYTPQEAKYAAQLWAEEAQDRLDAEEAFYQQDLRDYPSDRDPL